METDSAFPLRKPPYCLLINKEFWPPRIQLKLNTTGANAEEPSDALMEAGAALHYSGYAIDTPVLSRCRAKPVCSDTDVIGLFDAAETDMKDVVAILEQHPPLGAVDLPINRTTGR